MARTPCTLFIIVGLGLAMASVKANAQSGPLNERNKTKSDNRESVRAPVAAQPAARSGGCGNFFGTWTSGGGSWLYGANDTTFGANGTARHSSGIVGTWTCSGSVIDLEWKDWDRDKLRLSPDGKRLDSLAGGKGFQR